MKGPVLVFRNTSEPAPLRSEESRSRATRIAEKFARLDRLAPEQAEGMEKVVDRMIEIYAGGER